MNIAQSKLCNKEFSDNSYFHISLLCSLWRAFILVLVIFLMFLFISSCKFVVNVFILPHFSKSSTLYILWYYEFRGSDRGPLCLLE